MGKINTIGYNLVVMFHMKQQDRLEIIVKKLTLIKSKTRSMTFEDLQFVYATIRSHL